MKALEWLRVAMTLGLSVAEIVREARRKGDARPAKVIWNEVKAKRTLDRSYAENVERVRAQRTRLGLPERDE